MRIKKVVIAVLSFVLLAVAPAAKPDSEGLSFRSAIIGSTPGQTIAGIASGGAPWTVKRATVALNSDGKLRVKLQGLVIVTTGTAAPVTEVLASLVCGGSGGTIVAETQPVHLSLEGNAMIQAEIKLPAKCIAPVILIRVAGVNGMSLPLPLASGVPFIAATGVIAQSGGGDDEGDK